MRPLAFLFLSLVALALGYIAYTMAMKHVLNLHSKSECQDPNNWTDANGCKDGKCCGVWFSGKCFAGELKQDGLNSSCSFGNFKTPLIILGVALTVASIALSVLFYPSSSKRQSSIIVVAPRARPPVPDQSTAASSYVPSSN